MSRDTIFLYDLDREFLLFLLICNLKNDKNIYISYFEKKDILKKVSGKKIFLRERICQNKILNFILMQMYIKKIRFLLKQEIKKIETGEIKLFGSDVFWFGKELFYKEKLYILEDGTANYMGKEIRKRNQKEKINIKLEILKEIIKKLFFLNKREGEGGFGIGIEKVYLTENLCKKIPEGLEKKVEIINLKKLWDKKSEEEKKIILDTFNFNDEILKKVDENTIMLFTQPLSEDNVITEEEKVELYSKILKKYDNQSIIIKPHPREKTDYSKYFPSCYAMKERYPVEILELVGINIKKAVTIFSSAAFGLGKNIKIDFYGTEINDKIFNRFGTQDNVMKRNAFLD